jgi:hypothetical protein
VNGWKGIKALKLFGSPLAPPPVHFPFVPHHPFCCTRLHPLTVDAKIEFQPPWHTLERRGAWVSFQSLTGKDGRRFRLEETYPVGGGKAAEQVTGLLLGGCADASKVPHQQLFRRVPCR